MPTPPVGWIGLQPDCRSTAVRNAVVRHRIEIFRDARQPDALLGRRAVGKRGANLSGKRRTTGIGIGIGIVCVVAIFAAIAPAATAQTIYKCKNPDGRITYSNGACQGDGTPVSVLRGNATGDVRPGSIDARASASRASAPAGAADAALPDGTPAAPVVRALLPRQCDNGAALQTVVAKLASPATPDDTRAFLAGERFRLVRCEFMRFTVAERRERDAAMRELEAKDAAWRRQAMQRVDAVYDRYLTPSERRARARGATR